MPGLWMQIRFRCAEDPPKSVAHPDVLPRLLRFDGAFGTVFIANPIRRAKNTAVIRSGRNSDRRAVAERQDQLRVERAFSRGHRLRGGKRLLDPVQFFPFLAGRSSFGCDQLCLCQFLALLKARRDRRVGKNPSRRAPQADDVPISLCL